MNISLHPRFASESPGPVSPINITQVAVTVCFRCPQQVNSRSDLLVRAHRLRPPRAGGALAEARGLSRSLEHLL